MNVLEAAPMLLSLAVSHYGAFLACALALVLFELLSGWRITRALNGRATRGGLITCEIQSSGNLTAGATADIFLANERLQEQLRLAEAKLQEQSQEIELQVAMARTDVLTGLSNRRGFDDELRRRYAEWLRHNRPFSLVMIDLDFFKRVNDFYGHQAGDEVLYGVGTLLAQSFREVDFVARYGGEEFAVIMPDTALPQALAAIERVRRTVEDIGNWLDGRELKITVSAGAAQVMYMAEPATLVARSDAALYAAKSAGRNQTFFHDSQRCHPAAECALAPTAMVPAAVNADGAETSLV